MFYIYSGWEGLRSFDNFKVFEIFRYSIPLRTTEFNMFVGFHPTRARVDIQARNPRTVSGGVAAVVTASRADTSSIRIPTHNADDGEFKS